jgi:hypothetical protein
MLDVVCVCFKCQLWLILTAAYLSRRNVRTFARAVPPFLFFDQRFCQPLGTLHLLTSGSTAAAAGEQSGVRKIV